MAKKNSESKKLGRPTKFDPKFAEMLLEYFDIKPYEENNGQQIASDFPSLAGFAVKIGVNRDTLLEWANAIDAEGELLHPDFSGAYKRAKDFQENYMVINGNKGLLNPAFAIFTAKNVLGWRDKQKDEVDVIVNNNNSETMSDAELDSKLDRKLKKIMGKE